jgi:hypothetical protein
MYQCFGGASYLQPQGSQKRGACISGKQKFANNDTVFIITVIFTVNYLPLNSLANSLLT